VRAVVYDAGVLVAAGRTHRETWTDHNTLLSAGITPLVPSTVVAQVSRSPRQAQLRRFLAGCTVVAIGESEAHEAGRLLGIARTADVVDALVVVIASRNNALILTSEPKDIERLVSASGSEADVVAV
jgi:predicted nucleic acid-binding protein